MQDERYASLVVDDEEWIRQSLVTKLERSGLPFGSIVQAADSESALRIISSGFKPDIVLCDIRMPGGDGFSLSAEIGKRLPEAGIIIISGYSDFGYARKALQVGVRDYLLKPIDAFELYTAVKRCLDGIRVSRTTASKLDSIGIEAGMGGRGRPVVPQGGIVCAYLYAENTDAPRILASLEGHASSYAGFVCGYENRRNEFVLLFDGVSRAAACCADLLGILAALGIPEPVFGLSGPRERVEDAVNEATLHMKHRILAGGVGVIDETTCGNFVDRFVVPAYCIASLRHGLQSSSLTMVENAFDEILEELQAVRPSYHSVENTYLQLLMVAGESHSLDIEAKLACFPREVHIFTSLQSMFAFLKDVYASIINVSAVQRKTSKNDTVHGVAAFIEKNFADYITLERLAQDRGIHPCYLSLIFKEVMGINFQDFLLKVRIENAKILLSSGTARIADVAERTGFTNRFYFSRAFKKLTGRTPSEFIS